ncbi:hypothetical protein [Desulfosporosinus sp. OT]|uniref:hypothetical protein n=1 Tax=Desulfosporosinus sp. OT TaxID=913865 RepID=UPI000223A4A5|nr:hypothetical protein [Desulfosporosinus sp. OT]EGW37858.1 hypothetical protein DOT_4266 [Desulfosporosinus sp. OT]
MYKVTDEKELRIFNSIWTTVWKEKGYETEGEHSDDSTKFIIYSGYKPSGTVEFKSYNKQSPINQVFPFFQLCADLKIGNVVEVDKMAILKEYRRTPDFGKLILLVFDYFMNEDIKYGIALIEPKLFRLLHMATGKAIQPVGSKLFYKGDYVVPVILNGEALNNTLKQLHHRLLNGLGFEEARKQA